MTFVKGYKMDDKVKKKIATSQLRNTNGFKKGYTPWNKNRHERFVNHAYFKTWSSNMAYILGYIATDGCLYPSNGIKITSIDVDILEKISQEMQSTFKIGRHCAGAKHIQIYSEEIYNDLIINGITPRKSFTLKFPNIPLEYISHFIRGVFDGNGCVTQVNCGNSVAAWVSIASASKEFIKPLKAALNYMGLLGGNIYTRMPNKINGRTAPMYELSFKKYDSIKFYNIIYENADIFLNRKKEKFDNILQKVL